MAGLRQVAQSRGSRSPQPEMRACHPWTGQGPEGLACELAGQSLPEVCVLWIITEVTVGLELSAGACMRARADCQGCYG